MNELKELKQQNRQLQKLLKTAVELLNRYKHVIEQAGGTPPAAKRAAKRAKSKKTPHS